MMFKDRSASARLERARRIATIGLSDETRSALGRMLDVVSRRTQHEWTLATDPENAEALFVVAQSRTAFTASESAIPIVMVLPPETTQGVAGLSITQPFRVMPLLDVLLSLEQGTQGQFTAKSAASPPEPESGLIKSLQQLRRHGGTTTWYCARIRPNSIVWVKGDGSEVRTDPDTWRKIRQGSSICPDLEATDGTPDRVATEQLSVTALIWFTAMHTAADTGADASDPSIKLKFWPDFGRIGAERWHLKAAALMSRTRCSVADLVRYTGTGEESLRRFINACQHAGLLEHVGTTPPARTRAHGSSTRTAPVSLLGGLFNALRDRLGFNAHAH